MSSSSPTVKQPSANWQPFALVVGIVAVFLGYLSVWIPGPAAGLQFIGVEVGEWLKFLGVGRIRNIFYLPPFTLGAAMVLYSVDWSNRRWQSWVWRGLGVGVSLLAFPAFEDLMGGSRADYLPRIWMIVTVALLAIGVTIFSVFELDKRVRGLFFVATAVIAIVGAILPFWLFQDLQPTLTLIIGNNIRPGFGVWLNSVGHIALAAAAVAQVRK